MKKTIFALFFLSFVMMTFAQKGSELPIPPLPIDENTQLVTYKDVIQEPGTPQELYDRAMKWVAAFYKNTNEVIRLNDRGTGVINMRSSVRIYTVMQDGTKHFKNIVYYNFKLECREGRYRYTITDFNEKATSAAPIEVWFDTQNVKWNPGQYAFLNQIDEQIMALIESLIEGMEPKEEIIDEW